MRPSAIESMREAGINMFGKQPSVIRRLQAPRRSGSFRNTLLNAPAGEPHDMSSDCEKSPARSSAVGTLPSLVRAIDWMRPSKLARKKLLLRTTGPPRVPPN